MVDDYLQTLSILTAAQDLLARLIAPSPSAQVYRAPGETSFENDLATASTPRGGKICRGKGREKCFGADCTFQILYKWLLGFFLGNFVISLLE